MLLKFTETVIVRQLSGTTEFPWCNIASTLPSTSKHNPTPQLSLSHCSAPAPQASSCSPCIPGNREYQFPSSTSACTSFTATNLWLQLKHWATNQQLSKIPPIKFKRTGRILGSHKPKRSSASFALRSPFGTTFHCESHFSFRSVFGYGWKE